MIGQADRGGLAQLGEHLLCKQGVVGSIPTSSTNTFHKNDLVAGRSVESTLIRCKPKLLSSLDGQLWFAIASWLLFFNNS